MANQPGTQTVDKSDEEPMASWRDKGKVKALIKDVRAVRASAPAEYKSRFGFGEIGEYAVALSSQIEMHPEVPRSFVLSFAKQLVSSMANPEGPTPAKILEGLTDLERDFLRNRLPQRYALLTSISIDRRRLLHLGAIKRHIGGASIAITSSPPKKYQWGTVKKEIESYYFDEPFPRAYAFAVIRVDARTCSQAVSRATDALDFLRGLWAYTSRGAEGFHSKRGRREPLNDFCIGPVHILHHGDGKCADPAIWYEPEFTVPRKAKRLQAQKLDLLAKNERKLREWISDSPCADLFEQTFRRYARALDEVSMANCLLRLWGVLEAVTGTGGSNYNKTISRALFPLSAPGRRLNERLLNAAREQRNEIVHGEQDAHTLDDTIRALASYFHFLIPRLIWYSRTFDTAKEFFEYIDLSHDYDHLKKMSALYQRALDFRTPLETE